MQVYVIGAGIRVLDTALALGGRINRTNGIRIQVAGRRVGKIVA